LVLSPFSHVKGSDTYGSDKESDFHMWLFVLRLYGITRRGCILGSRSRWTRDYLGGDWLFVVCR
jgi:hypothetical protein